LRGHDFSHAIEPVPSARTLLPQAGVQPQAKRPTCLPLHAPNADAAKLATLNSCQPLQTVENSQTPQKHWRKYRSESWHTYPTPFSTIEIALHLTDVYKETEFAT
jgi:hypothetical protein